MEARNKFNNTLLHEAALKGHEGVARVLVEAGADVRAINSAQDTPLHLAASRGHEGVARVLVEAGADVRAVDRDQSTLLHLAASYGREGVARVLVEAGADVNAVDRIQIIPLHLAAFYGHEGVARMLVEAGADVRAVEDRDQRTPLHLAVINGHEGVARVLIEAGADVRAVDRNQYTPLHYAAINGHERVARVLVEERAEVGAVDRYQYTPLHLAASRGHEGVARVLVEAGADVRALDEAENTPLHLAAINGHERVAKMLEEAGAGVVLVNVVFAASEEVPVSLSMDLRSVVGNLKTINSGRKNSVELVTENEFLSQKDAEKHYLVVDSERSCNTGLEALCNQSNIKVIPTGSQYYGDRNTGSCADNALLLAASMKDYKVYLLQVPGKGNDHVVAVVEYAPDQEADVMKHLDQATRGEYDVPVVSATSQDSSSVGDVLLYTAKTIIIPNGSKQITVRMKETKVVVETSDFIYVDGKVLHKPQGAVLYLGGVPVSDDPMPFGGYPGRYKKDSDDGDPDPDYYYGGSYGEKGNDVNNNGFPEVLFSGADADNNSDSTIINVEGRWGNRD